jgi:hypothetical protein
MRPSLRFLALVTIGWAGFRAYQLGAFPDGSFRLVERSEAKTAPSIVPTEFPPIEPVQTADQAPPTVYPNPYAAYGTQPTQMVPLQVKPVGVPVYYYGVNSVHVPLPPARPAEAPDPLPEPRRVIYAQVPELYAQLPDTEQNPLSRLASIALGQQRSSSVPIQSTPVIDPNRLDRWQVSAWAMVRNQQTGAIGPSSLAGSGNLGASQAGARLTYLINRQIAASLRTSSDIGRRGFEVAAGVRVQPLQSIPVWITAERRQRIGQFGGRNAFAIFAETGVYQRPLPWQLNLDAYLQGGVVGLKSRDLFLDGALAITRPVYKNFSAGFGVWGGAQPGLYRVDAGPRISMQVRKNVRVHFDYRQRVAGNALPGSGPAITLAADF